MSKLYACLYMYAFAIVSIYGRETGYAYSTRTSNFKESINIIHDTLLFVQNLL